ncbi:MAG: hypothetical protein ACR2KV_05280 [Solirubrobacteraceae bacterium]
MPVERIAILSEVPGLAYADMVPVVAALQKQIDHDFGPIWDVKAELCAADAAHPPPAGAWTITVVAHVDGPAGFHHDDHGRPVAVVEYGPHWPLTVSHELLEMLVDPLGNKILPAPSPRGDGTEVHFFVEVCDPCQERIHAYEIDGVTVADFVTPDYYRPGATRCSFWGSVTAPFQVLEGGYVTWHAPKSREVWQDQWPSGGQRGHVKIGKLDDLLADKRRLREWIDQHALGQGLSPHAQRP